MMFSEKYRRFKVAGHLLFWMGSLIFALTVFYIVSDHQLGITPGTIVRAVAINLGFALAVYTNFYLLIPFFLKKKNYIFYIFWLIITLAASSLLIITLSFIFQEQAFSKHLFSTHFFTSSVYVGITSLAKFLTDWLELQDISLRYHKVEREKLEAELNTLKAQINPHFLFNSLNNIYSLALVNSKKTPEMILKLSDLMRYVLYESRENFIPLKKEIGFIKNFIELQRIRLSEKTDIGFECTGDANDRLIIPLIFEPFVDNAFKHGPKSLHEKAYIHISIRIEGNWLYFLAENNFGDDMHNDGIANGIGLKNVQKRLSHLYEKGQYHLDISRKENIFKVELRLILKTTK
jgi:LytS/YehU family sensor histidine kinase